MNCERKEQVLCAGGGGGKTDQSISRGTGGSRGFGPFTDSAENCKQDPRANGVQAAAEILKADAEHRSLAADQALMLRMTMPMLGVGLRTLAEGIYKWCRHQGFWPVSNERYGGLDQDDASERMKKAEKIALIHSEVSEVLEAIRKGDRFNEAEELADVAIRLLDYCGRYNIDLGAAIEQKMLRNYQRPFKNGKAF